MIRPAPEEGGQSTKTILFLTVNHSLGSPACNELHCHSLHIGSIFSAFLGPSIKTKGRTNRWMNSCNKNNSAITPEHLRERVYGEKPYNGKGRVRRPLQYVSELENMSWLWSVLAGWKPTLISAIFIERKNIQIIIIIFFFIIFIIIVMPDCSSNSSPF